MGLMHAYAKLKLIHCVQQYISVFMKDISYYSRKSASVIIVLTFVTAQKNDRLFY